VAERSQALKNMPVILATQEAEIRRIAVKRLPARKAYMGFLERIGNFLSGGGIPKCMVPCI
jgi:hypothetical protein